MAIPIGRNLQDTLLFCLVPQNRMTMQSDTALWEKTPETTEYLKTKIRVPDKKVGEDKARTVERGATGIVDLYLWRTRSTIFRYTSTGLVSELGFASGVGYKESLDFDPMLGYMIKEITDKETKAKVKRKFSLQFSEKGTWRDFDSLLPDADHLAPRVIEHAVTLTRHERDRFPRGVMVLGQKYFPPRPNIAFWRKEYFALPDAVSGDRSIRKEVYDMLVDAENSAISLNIACESFAKDLLGHGGRKIEKADVGNFVAQISAPARYWSELETKFHEILREYHLERDPDDIRCQWLKAVRAALSRAWAQHSASVSSGDAWAIRALVKAEAPVLRKLKELNTEILKYAPQKETA